jgi:parvulin-like peptidyl-prolyl isomerase
VGEYRLDNPPAGPVELTSLGQATTPEQASPPEPASPRAETPQVPKLAPIEEQTERDLGSCPDEQASGKPAFNQQDEPQQNTAAEAGDRSPWHLEAVHLARQEKPSASQNPQEQLAGPDIAPPVQDDEPVVMNKAQVVAGLTLQVNTRHITADEILAALHQKLLKIPRHISREAFSRHAARLIRQQITYQIQQVLVSEEARRYLEDGAKEQINKEMAQTLRNMIARSGGSEEKLKQKCLREGTTLLDILKSQRMNMTVNIYLRSKFYPAIVVNRRMLWKYYRKNRSEFVSPKKVQMQIIAAPWRAFVSNGDKKATPEEQDEARSEAHEIIQQAWRELQSGRDFGDIARRLSRGVRARHGGVWPMMSAGNFKNAPVESVAFTLGQGRHSKIIETPSGFYIVKAKDIMLGKEVPFELAQEQIEQKLRMEQFVDLRANYMKNLYDRATIGDTQSFLILTVDRAVQKYYR